MSEEIKNPVGRPTDYRPEFCEQIIELGTKGMSVVQFACHFSVVKQTMLNWANEYPEFMDALTRAKQLSQYWWEEKAQTNLTADKFQASLWSRSMAARFPDDYREKQTIAHEGGDPDKPINMTRHYTESDMASLRRFFETTQTPNTPPEEA